MAIYTIDNPERIATCLPLLTADDVILLMGQACEWHGSLPPIDTIEAKVVALPENGDPVAPELTVIDYADWVALTERHDQHVHWH